MTDAALEQQIIQMLLVKGNTTTTEIINFFENHPYDLSTIMIALENLYINNIIGRKTTHYYLIENENFQA